MGWRFFNYELIKDRHTDRCQLLSQKVHGRRESSQIDFILLHKPSTWYRMKNTVHNELIFYPIMTWVQQPILPGSAKILLSLFIRFQVYEEISIKFWFSIGFLQWDDMLIKHTLTFPGKIFLIVNFKFSFWV